MSHPVSVAVVLLELSSGWSSWWVMKKEEKKKETPSDRLLANAGSWAPKPRASCNAGVKKPCWGRDGDWDL